MVDNVRKRGLVLAIETSFDDTAIALIDEEFHVHYSAVSSSIRLHAPYGGVVPEIAARDHLRNLPLMLNELKSEDSSVLARTMCVGVTRGPGLPGCLLAGINFARGLASALSIPVFGLNHLEGHLYSPFFGTHIDEIAYPFVALVVTGGNTVLYLADSFGEHKVLGQTLDDAAGELFDKISYILGLGYPGGKKLEELALVAKDEPIPKELILPVPMKGSGDLNFSFSGLKTACMRLIKRLGLAVSDKRLPYFCASLFRSVCESLVLKVEEAVRLSSARTVAVSGGVAINKLLRSYLDERLSRNGVAVLYPDDKRCTDNAEMMAYLLALKLEAGEYPSSFDMDANLI